MTNIKEIRLDNIHIDDSLQLRVEGTEPETVQEYAGLVKAGIDMDPVDVVAVGLDWNVDADYVLAHGHHRYDAHVAADRQTIRAIVHDGGRAKARFLAQTGNITNGKPLSKEDKLLVMVDMVLDPAYSDYSSRQFKSEFGIYSQPVWAAVMQVAQMVQQTAPPLLDDEIIEQGSYNSVNERLISLVRERTGISEPLERKWTIGTLVQIDDDHDYFGWRGWITGHMPNGGGVHVLAHQFGKYYWKLSNRSAGYESLSPLKSDSSYSSLWLEKLRREKQVEHVLFKWSDYFVQIDTRTNLDDNAKLHGVDWDKYNFSYPDSDMIALASRISPELLGWYREQFPEEQILVLMPDRINDERMKAIVLKACRARGGAINEPPAPGAPDMEPDNGFQAAASGDDDLITQINANVPGHIDSSDWYGVYQYISRQHAPHLTVIDVPGIGLFAKNTPGNKNQRLALDISHRWKVKLNSTVIYEDREGFFDTARSVDLPVYWYRWVSHDLPDWIERIQSDDLPYSVSKTDTSNSGGCNGNGSTGSLSARS